MFMYCGGFVLRYVYILWWIGIVLFIYCVTFMYRGRVCIVLCLCIVVSFVLCYVYILR
jgi:hypothetical protein